MVSRCLTIDCVISWSVLVLYPLFSILLTPFWALPFVMSVDQEHDETSGDRELQEDSALMPSSAPRTFTKVMKPLVAY